MRPRSCPTRVDPADPSYVYRVYDEFGRLLYVGCSINPIKRLTEHAPKNWFPYALKVDVRGPWTRTTAMRIEETAIATEVPYFNALPEHTRSITANRNEAVQRMRADGFVRFGADRTPTQEWYDTQARYCLAARDTHPVVDDAERLKRYLAQRASCEQARLPEAG